MTQTLECSHCGHKTTVMTFEGHWCLRGASRGTPTCTGTYIPAPQRQPWDQGGPDTRLATIGELRAAMKSIDSKP